MRAAQLTVFGAAWCLQVDNEDKLGRVLEKYSDYKPLWEAAPVDEVHTTPASPHRRPRCWLTPVVSTPPCLLPQDGHKQITNTLYEYTTEQLELAFEGQFHYGTLLTKQSLEWLFGVLIKLATCVLLRPRSTGVFYAYVKLKEQETKNIVFFCDCIEQGHTPELGDIIPVFSKHSKWRTR